MSLFDDTRVNFLARAVLITLLGPIIWTVLWSGVIYSVGEITSFVFSIPERTYCENPNRPCSDARHFTAVIFAIVSTIVTHIVHINHYDKF